MTHVDESRSLVDRMLGRLALLGLWLPVVLVVHFFIRLAGIGEWWGGVILAFIAAGVVLGDRSTLIPSDKSSTECPSTPCRKWDAALCALLLLSVTLPVIWNYGAMQQQAPDGLYLFADDAYEVEIAQGIKSSFPPPDLGYSGRVLHYHYGHALALDLLRSCLRISLPVSMYVVFPVLCHMIIAGSVYRFMKLMVPSSSVHLRLLATLAAGGFWTVEPLNLLWHLRVMSKGDLAPWFGDISVAVVHDCGQMGFVCYGHVLVTTLLAGLLGNLDRCPVVCAAAVLFAVFLSKSQLILPVGLAWMVFAAHALLRDRNWRPFAAGAAGLLLILCTKRILVPISDDLQLYVGAGYMIDQLQGNGRAFVRALGLDGDAAAVAVAIGSKILGLHIAGLAVVRLIGRREVGMSHVGQSLLCLTMGVAILGAVCATFVVLEPSRETVRAFELIHRDIQNLLWLPFDGYLSRMMLLSLGGPSLSVVSQMIAMTCTGALLSWYCASGRGVVRLALRVFACTCVVVTLYRSANVLRLEQLRHATSVPGGVVSCLAQIPVAGSIVLTNAVSYDNKNAPHLPLLNVWAPAQSGHQFWACDFMYNANFTACDAEYRLASLAWFWKTPYSDRHSQFLAEHRITHLLVDVSQLVDEQLPLSDDLKVLKQSGEFAALKVVSGHRAVGIK